MNIVPLDDERKHVLSGKCPCEPMVFKGRSGEKVIKHIPYDLRVILEDMGLDHGKKYIALDSDKIDYTENQQI